ncbi:MAG: VWA domain-containing protein [Methylophilaceae bacterium]|nr:VWA domain-containing protein [Methylophilaceae bacterium]MBL6729278.1 VWA domain-containing protein [Methylophilaceae bacterium]
MNFFKKLKEDINFLFLFLSVFFLGVAIINPSIPITKNMYNYIFIVDISQSMNTEDMKVNNEKVSRMAYTKDLLHRLLERLPCKTKVSIGMFAGVSVAAAYTPIEVCDNFSSINGTVENLDWRSTWSGNTRIRESMVNLARLIRSFPESAQVIFFTDGEEAPKLHVFNRRDLSQFQGGQDWLFVGIGSDEGAPIPKYDNKNQLIGYWSNESFALQPGIAQISESNLGTRDNKTAYSESDRYISKLDDEYLRNLSKEVKGMFIKGDSPDSVLKAMEKQKPAWRDQTTYPLRYIFSFLALALFVLRFVTREKLFNLLSKKNLE